MDDPGAARQRPTPPEPGAEGHELVGQLAADARSFLISRWDASPETIRSYTEALRQFAAYLDATGSLHPASREDVEGWLAALRADGRRPSTILTRFRALRAFYRWLAEEDGTPDPTARVRQPKVPAEPVPVPTVEEVEAILGACRGDGFAERRDLAVLTLLFSTGCRLSEVANLRVADLDWGDRVILVTGKGRKVRVVPFDHRAARALDRYQNRAGGRRSHAEAGSPWLWLGDQGRLTAAGIAKVCDRRGNQAGVKFHAHLARHWYASRWLASGGAEGDLMRLAGWTTRRMIDRYGAGDADRRARAAYRDWSPFD